MSGLLPTTPSHGQIAQTPRVAHRRNIFRTSASNNSYDDAASSNADSDGDGGDVRLRQPPGHAPQGLATQQTTGRSDQSKISS